MAYPSIASSTKGSITTNATSTTITVPSGTQAGDLMILIISKDGTGVFTKPTDWSTLANTAGAAQTTGVFYRILTGALSDFTIAHASEQTAWTLLRIANGDTPSINSRANGSSTSPNPASHSHGFGTGVEVLWIALAGWDYNRTCSGYPWTGGQDTQRANTTGGSGIARCTMTSTSASEDAGNFTISATDTWDAYTIAVKLVTPSGGASAEVDVASQGSGTHIGSGSANSEVDVSTQASGTKIASGSSQSTVEIGAEGAGEVVAVVISGGAESSVIVSTQASGTKIASGSSNSQVKISPTGAAAKISSGSSSASVAISSAGAGAKICQGSQESQVIISSQGGGIVILLGGSESNVYVSTEGNGHPIGVYAEGGSVAEIEITPEGTMTTIRTGSNDSGVDVETAGSGVKIASGQSDAGVRISVSGAYLRLSMGNSESNVIISSVGSGGAFTPYEPIEITLSITQNSATLTALYIQAVNSIVEHIATLTDTEYIVNLHQIDSLVTPGGG